MRTFLKFFFIAILLFSCDFNSTKDKEIILRREKIQKPQSLEKECVSNKILALDVEGMSCEMSCGGSIRVGVMDLGGVERVRFNFVEGEQKQRTFIIYDDNQIKKDNIISKIKTINDQQFSVQEISLKNYTPELKNTSPNNSAANSNGSVSNQNISILPELKIPNLIDVLSDFISG